MARRANKNLKSKDSSKNQKSYFDKLDTDIKTNQSKLSMVLGILILLVIGILIFNYFQKGKENLGPAQQTQQEGDVSPQNLPGKYTVKDGDTLFTIADKYYKDGYKFSEIAKANNITNADSIATGQVLEIPNLSEEAAQASPLPSPSPTESPSSNPEVSPTPSIQPELGTGTGGADTTIWGPAIHGDTYTVVDGDWLSKIAGRAYGDIFAYTKLAQANNIQNPDLIYPGQVLKIPR